MILLNGCKIDLMFYGVLNARFRLTYLVSLQSRCKVSKQHHAISVSITRHALDPAKPEGPATILAGYSRSLDGKVQTAASVGYATESEAIARAYLNVQCTRSQNTGFADCIYTRQIEIYGSFRSDLEALRAIEAECQGRLLGPATEDWRGVDSIILNLLGVVVYGSTNSISESASGSPP